MKQSTLLKYKVVGHQRKDRVWMSLKGLKGIKNIFQRQGAGIHCQGEITYMVIDILVLYNESAILIDKLSNGANSQYSVCQHKQLFLLPNQWYPAIRI